MILDWRRNYIDQRVKAVIPQFANKLPPLEIYYIDAGLLNDDATRFSSYRPVNLNRIGASFDYYSCPEVTGNPLQGGRMQNAVSFWRGTPQELILLLRQDPLTDTSLVAGLCIPTSEPGAGYSFIVPEITSRICAWPDHLTFWRTTLGCYYNLQQHQAEWPAAFNQMLAWIMQHESGHSTAMDEETTLVNWYMYPFLPVQDDPLQPNYGKFFPVGTVFDYDNLSRSQFTITPGEQ